MWVCLAAQNAGSPDKKGKRLFNQSSTFSGNVWYKYRKCYPFSYGFDNFVIFRCFTNRQNGGKNQLPMGNWIFDNDIFKKTLMGKRVFQQFLIKMYFKYILIRKGTRLVLLRWIEPCHRIFQKIVGFNRCVVVFFFSFMKWLHSVQMINF